MVSCILLSNDDEEKWLERDITKEKKRIRKQYDNLIKAVAMKSIV